MVVMPKCRCPWCESHPLYVRYHDDIWGVPEHNDRALFEKLILDGFQAGLTYDHLVSCYRHRELAGR